VRKGIAVLKGLKAHRVLKVIPAQRTYAWCRAMER